MTREEAIKEIKEWDFINKDEMEVLATLIPELAESEDERIRKALVWHLKADVDFVSNGVTKAECIDYLENLKDASYAIEAIEKIDKYIDEHLANAHDMKDSNPDKKYYRGWDDALGEMSGILQDVYSNEKRKECLADNSKTSASEDERIRKWLCDYFSSIDKAWIHKDITCIDILRWLEKQKEQKKEKFPPYVTGFKGHPDSAGTSDLEEAAKEYASKTLCDPDDGPSTGLAKESFIAGAKWQRKQDAARRK